MNKINTVERLILIPSRAPQKEYKNLIQSFTKSLIKLNRLIFTLLRFADQVRCL